ncbi:iron(III) dicitrate transport system permease protein [Oceanicola granulosus HTCC2516]|uniref:Iron(III) dicitrate transport system permease protein n=1 Tax=Oceanicola granulosus (strain ATCC BAA-861 / DSM 15982 / KCTC 12143 / HTCC2516) TaxID=314256 RepID=Q2CF55_OCEGH|nr:iron ABC transporter permease [Oceanicola granulosus]EAR51272.1 iron(III) dicitrate transport system permease protein [Oceanicola granulosus HTCC2516]
MIVPLERPGLSSLAPLLGIAAVSLAFAWHISVGARSIPLHVVVEALLSYDPALFDHVVVVDLRLPRALLAALVGAALAVAGALMQGVTRNPLAEPGILGLLVGASFAVVVVVGVFDLTSPTLIPLVAAVGAVLAAGAVWGIAAAAPGGAAPLTLILAGAAVMAFLAALVTVASLLDEQTFEQLRVWMTGSLAGAQNEVLKWALPWFGAGLIVALAVARQVTALAMGEETAIGLGTDVVRLKALSLFAVVALTAAAVALAGPMGFVGLVVPHAVRLLVGQDYRRIVPWSALAGAGYLLVIDVVARLLLAPVEISTGLVTALIGAPIFVWLVRTRL